MALTLEQLLTPITIPQAQQFMIDVLKSLGFTGAASWQSGSFGRTLGIEVPARLMSNVRDLIVAYGKGGYNDEARGDWLTLFSKSHYDNDRVGAVRTQGVVQLTSAVDADTHVIAAGELVVADAIEGRTFRGLEAFTLAAGEQLDVTVEAEVAGRESNVPLDTITIMQVSYAGVTVNNPGIDGVWITQVGADAELDPELQQRNRTKWATRAYATPEAGYENYALEADASITRVFVDGQNPEGPGSVKIYIAGADGGSPPLVAATVEDYIEGLVDGIVRRPLCAIVSCEPAVDHVVSVEAQVFIAAAYNGVAQPAVLEALEDLFESIPIGGTQTTGSGRVQFSSLYMAVMTVPGVINVIFSAPTGDVILLPSEVAVPDIGIDDDDFVVI